MDIDSVFLYFYNMQNKIHLYLSYLCDYNFS